MQGRASTDLGPYMSTSSLEVGVPSMNHTKPNQYPITFQHLGRNTPTQYTLYAPSPAVRKPWLEKIRLQQEEKNKRSPIFELIPVIQEKTFYSTTNINHFITFSKCILVKHM
jgi:hypothetical protein